MAGIESKCLQQASPPWHVCSADLESEQNTTAAGAAGTPEWWGQGPLVWQLPAGRFTDTAAGSVYKRLIMVATEAAQGLAVVHHLTAPITLAVRAEGHWKVDVLSNRVHQ